MSRGNGVRTEEVPRGTAFQGTPVRFAKTSPAALVMVRDPSSDSTNGASFGPHERFDWPTSSTPSGTDLHIDAATNPPALEYLESDVSSASGRSSSASLASTPACREMELISDTAGIIGTLPGNHRNTTYASQMHMCQFRREQSLFEWGAFVHRLKEGLPEKPVLQNEFFQLIDYGGSGSVYATAFKTHRGCDTLAIKVLRNKKAETTTELPNEFQIMQGLRHNHVVAFVGAFSRKGQFAVLMYPVAICNLAEYLKDVSESNIASNGQDTSKRRTLLKAIGCLSSAVMHLHITRKIKHKDIKPENILFNRHESVLLADFGVSRQYEDDTFTEGTTPFTDKYAAPEVVDHDKRGLSTDIFSLGCVFLEMATVILGESLENLNRVVFESSDGQCYRDFPLGVGIWVGQLKRMIGLEAHSCYLAGSQIPGDNDCFNSHTLTTEHLDAVLRMMSKSPVERPSITTVYEMFKGFAEQCLECQATNGRPLEACEFSSKIQVLPVALTETRVITDHKQPAFQAVVHQDLSRDGFAWNDPSLGYLSIVGTAKAHSPLAIDEFENDYLSEAESDIADDFDLEFGAEPKLRILKAIIQRLLDSQRSRILSFLNSGSFRRCPAEGSSANRRQGSPINGPPSKRRSVERGKIQQLPEGNGNAESDGEEDPGERRGWSVEPKPNNPSPSRLFACPYYQRDRNRCTNRACKGPGWASFPRLKEHLVRVHRLYRCPRCQEKFHHVSELNSHQRKTPACDVRDRELDDTYDWGQGFDDYQYNDIKLRLRGLTHEEKWKRCYTILFPRDPHMPSAYCTDEAAERISHVTNMLSQDISGRYPEISWPGLVQFIQERLEIYARQDQVGRELMADNLSSPGSSIMQPASDRTHLASELRQVTEPNHSGYSGGISTGSYLQNEQRRAAFPGSLHCYARQDERDMGYTDLSRGLSFMQQPTPDHTRTDPELDKISDASRVDFSSGVAAIGYNHNDGPDKTFHNGNHANTTTDSACFTASSFTSNSMLDFGGCIEPLPEGFSLDEDFGFHDGSVSLGDFPSSYGAGHVTPEVPDQGNDG